MKQLILGGVRSGKSALAEKLAEETALPVTYIATATAGDREMAVRIKAHQSRRPAGWQTIEEPLNLAASLQKNARQDRCLLVDCLTLWLTNLLLADDQDLLEREITALLDTLPALPGPLIFVSNESNMGITPMDAISRRYCDEAGALHQQLATLCDRVIMVIAGLPQILKGDDL